MKKSIKKYRFIDIFLSIISVVAVALFCVALAAFIPCFFKGFYTPWINWLHIPEDSGYSFEEIKYAYGNLLDFIWRGAEFNPGMAMTEEGIDHFRDCIPLFWMQLWFFLGGGLYLLTYGVLIKLGKVRRVNLGKLPVYAYGGILMLALLIVIGVYAAIDFDSLFILFHKVFFPGKDNWNFDPRFDKVILILPEEYFLVCAVFIVSSAVILAVLFIVCGALSYKKRREQEFVKKYFDTVLVLSDISKVSEKAVKKLSVHAKEKILSFKNENDRKLSSLARLLEKEYLDNHKVYYLDSKKPYLKSVIQYNLSHKGECVLLGLSSCSIGVDLELEKDLAQSFIDFSFSKAEVKNMEVFNISPIQMWTIKEALLKCLGSGINVKLNQEELIFNSGISFIYKGTTYFYKTFTKDNYVISVVLTENKLPQEVKYE